MNAFKGETIVQYHIKNKISLQHQYLSKKFRNQYMLLSRGQENTKPFKLKIG